MDCGVVEVHTTTEVLVELKVRFDPLAAFISIRLLGEKNNQRMNILQL